MKTLKYLSLPSNELEPGGAEGDARPSGSNSRPAAEVTRVASGRRQTEKTVRRAQKTHQALWGERYTMFKSSFTKTEQRRRTRTREGRKGGEQLANNKEFTGGRKRRRRSEVDLRAQIFERLDKHIYEKSQTLRSQFILSDNVFSSNPGPVRMRRAATAAAGLVVLAAACAHRNRIIITRIMMY